MKIAITGANGQLGRCFMELSDQFPEFDIHFFDRSQWDICDITRTEEVLSSGFSLVINTAAYTAVDNAEEEVDQCETINTSAVKNLVSICRKRSTQLLHFSSDYVYHNSLRRPLREYDSCTPKGVYASSKFYGEDYVAQYEKGLVIRTSWVYSSYGHNFLKTMLRLSESHDKIKVVQDQWGCPTNAHIMALDVLTNLIEQKGLRRFGLLNYTHQGITNWFEFARLIFELKMKDVEVTPISTDQYPTKAQRPSFSVLNCDEYDKISRSKRCHWTEAVKDCILRL